VTGPHLSRSSPATSTATAEHTQPGSPIFARPHCTIPRLPRRSECTPWRPRSAQIGQRVYQGSLTTPANRTKPRRVSRKHDRVWTNSTGSTLPTSPTDWPCRRRPAPTTASECRQHLRRPVLPAKQQLAMRDSRPIERHSPRGPQLRSQSRPLASGKPSCRGSRRRSSCHKRRAQRPCRETSVWIFRDSAESAGHPGVRRLQRGWSRLVCWNAPFPEDGHSGGGWIRLDQRRCDRKPATETT
jgi:hypothetical protein